VAKVDWFPKACGKFITPKKAWLEIEWNSVNEVELSTSMKSAAQKMIAGNYSGSNAEKAFRLTRGSTAGAINTKLLSWDRVSCTLPKSIIAETGIIHPGRQRYISIPEASRIQSFPDEFFLAEIERKNGRV